VTEYRPLHRTAPPYVRTAGHLAAKVGQRLGLPPDPEQQWFLDQCFGEDARGLPSAPDACIVGPRQTVGKSAALEVAALTDLFTFRVELHVWTAHEWKTARKSYEDMRRRILRHPDYAAITTFHGSQGEEKIILDTGESIEFHARSGGSGRGFTTRRLTLDEALFLQPGDLGALVPTGVTIPDFQVRYGSSAGKSTSAALRALRDRGRAGDPGLAYLELGAEERPCEIGAACRHELEDPGCALNHRDLWWQANSGLWVGRGTEEAIERQRRTLAGQPEEFAREFLSWWDDPAGEIDGLDFARWVTLVDIHPERGRPTFAVATAPDRSWSSVAIAWRQPSIDLFFVMVGDDYRPGTAWVPGRIAELRSRWGGRVLVDAASRGLVPDAVEVSHADQAKAHNALADAVTAGTVRHGNEPALNTAVRAARWRSSGDTRVLDRRGAADISPLVAAALALWGASRFPTRSIYEDRGLELI
jgi:hypothetical protein